MGAKSRVCSRCPTRIEAAAVTGLCKPCFIQEMAAARARYVANRSAVEPATRVAEDRERKRLLQDLSDLRRKYDESLKTIEQQAHAIATADKLYGSAIDTFEILPQERTGTSEATAVWVASDWHIEERVGPEVGSLNRYNLDIAKSRATQFFQHGLRLTDLLAQDVQINAIVLALLGDFISNDIHEEFPEITGLAPMHAIVETQKWIASGIEYILAHSAYTLVVPCHSGNHARTTRTTRFSTENGHSLEFLMYRHLAEYFRHEPRVQFIIPAGMHSYVAIYDRTIRFHHGHAIRYAGGVGGIYIPVNKAIAQWNKGRHADLDVFGHFHQLRDGGNFLCNGSLIGYNAFALSIKADYDLPKQALFLVDKKRGRTCTWPILFDDKKVSGS